MTEKAKTDKAATAPKWSLLESAIWSPAKAGDNVTGRLGPQEIGQNGPQHTLTSLEGEKITLPRLVVLKDLDRVLLGTLVRITYTGDKVGEVSGKTYKDFDIEQDKSTTPRGGA